MQLTAESTNDELNYCILVEQNGLCVSASVMVVPCGAVPVGRDVVIRFAVALDVSTDDTPPQTRRTATSKLSLKVLRRKQQIERLPSARLSCSRPSTPSSAPPDASAAFSGAVSSPSPGRTREIPRRASAALHGRAGTRRRRERAATA